MRIQCGKKSWLGPIFQRACELIIEILSQFILLLILILMMQSGQEFAANLWPDCILFSDHFSRQSNYEFSQDLDYEVIKPLWNGF